MVETWRVIDTGLRAAAQNIALDRALLEARQAEEITSTLRFYRCMPAVLLASRHSAAHEAEVDFCSQSGIAIQRRITGGDSIYCDGAQLGWALYLHQRDVGTSDMRAVASRICHAVAAALDAPGVEAHYRAPDQIATQGRRICAGGGVFEGDALLYAGIAYFDLDVATALRALRTPAQGLADHAFEAARARMADLKLTCGEAPAFAFVRDRVIAALENEFAVEFQEADLSLTEHARYQHALAEIDTPGWANLVQQPASDVAVASASHPYAGGLLHTSVLHDRIRRRIKQVWFTHSDYRPPTATLLAFEAHLNDTAVDRLERNTTAFFSAHALPVPASTAADFIAVLRRALQLPLIVTGL
jgi:lipoate-protein ligase A